MTRDELKAAMEGNARPHDMVMKLAILVTVWKDTANSAVGEVFFDTDEDNTYTLYPVLKSWRSKMHHVFLLGDSIFDNAPYVPKGCEVQAQLQAMLGDGHRVILLARDGDVLADVKTQVSRLQNMSTQSTNVVVSCGGNDVLGLVGYMQSSVKSVIEAAELLASWQAEFRVEYRRMLDEVLAQRLPVAIATIYDGVPGLSTGLRTALTVFNDVILREAAARRLPVLDLRLVCDHPGDYSPISPIEPSQQGARKIAAAIAELVRSQDTSVQRTVVFGASLN